MSNRYFEKLIKIIFTLTPLILGFYICGWGINMFVDSTTMVELIKGIIGAIFGAMLAGIGTIIVIAWMWG